MNLASSMHKNTTVVEIQGVKTKALIDTGAQISCCSSVFFNKLSFTPKVLNKSEYPFIKGVGGKPLKVLGKIPLPLSFQGAIYTHCIHVVENLDHSLIVGMDFWGQNGVKLCLKTNTLHFSDTTPKVCLIHTRAGLARATKRFLFSRIMKSMSLLKFQKGVQGTPYFWNHPKNS